jgi:NitT/TauT family transport system substrate-binding protein
MPTRHACIRTLISALLILTAPPAGAAELLRVGKSVPEAFSFVPLDVGMRVGLFRKYGVEIELSALSGGARLQQALAGDSIDIGLGSGPEMAAIQKGSPVKAVAAMAGAPRLLALLVRPDNSIKSVADLKGRKIGRHHHQLPHRLAGQRAGAPAGLGPERHRCDAARHHAGTIRGAENPSDRRPGGRHRDASTGAGQRLWQDPVSLRRSGEGFPHPCDLRHLIAQRPDAIRSFLEAWFETIAFMRADRARTIDIAKDIISVDPAITAQTYDELMPMFSADGKFNPKALAVLSRSYVDLGILPSEPDMSKFYTEEFLPN